MTLYIFGIPLTKKNKKALTKAFTTGVKVGTKSGIGITRKGAIRAHKKASEFHRFRIAERNIKGRFTTRKSKEKKQAELFRKAFETTSDKE